MHVPWVWERALASDPAWCGWQSYSTTGAEIYTQGGNRALNYRICRWTTQGMEIKLLANKCTRRLLHLAIKAVTCRLVLWDSDLPLVWSCPWGRWTWTVAAVPLSPALWPSLHWQAADKEGEETPVLELGEMHSYSYSYTVHVWITSCI